MKLRFDKRKQLVCQVALVASGIFGGAYIGWTANTDIATEPLTAGVSGVKPNIMFILDDSGSMSWDYMPDHVTNGNPSNNSDTAACFDSGDSNYSDNNNNPFINTSSDDNDDASGLITGRRDACQVLI